MFQETNHELNFVNYAFRHRTLTLLGEVKQCQEKYESSPRFGNEGYFSSGNISDCKMKMSKLFDEMIKYMEDNNDKQNKFIKMLCDDIHISQKTLGTKYGRMCISSRQTSQGTQRIYTVNTTPLDRTRGGHDFDSDSDDDLDTSSRNSAAVCAAGGAACSAAVCAAGGARNSAAGGAGAYSYSIEDLDFRDFYPDNEMN